MPRPGPGWPGFWLRPCNKTLEELQHLKMREAKLSTKVNGLQVTDCQLRMLIEENNKQMKFYTGLPSFDVLLAIYRLVIKGLIE